MEFSNNKRAQDSQRAIYKGLRRLLERKDLKDITVVDLQNECNISRATFYRNYRNIIDVLDVIFKWYFNEYQELKKKKMISFFSSSVIGIYIVTFWLLLLKTISILLKIVWLEILSQIQIHTLSKLNMDLWHPLSYIGLKKEKLLPKNYMKK